MLDKMLDKEYKPGLTTHFSCVPDRRRLKKLTSKAGRVPKVTCLFIGRGELVGQQDGQGEHLTHTS